MAQMFVSQSYNTCANDVIDNDVTENDVIDSRMNMHILLARSERGLSPVSTTRVDGPSWRPELKGDRFPLPVISAPVNTARVDG